MPPEPHPVCRFAAEPPQSPPPTGAWADALRAFLLAALREVDTDDVDLGEPGQLVFYPDRTWAGRTYVPATARTSTGYEIYGYVSFLPGEEPSDLHGVADFTDELAERHPEWRLDLSEEVVGGWRGEAGAVAAMTLVWGVALLGGGRTVTGELGPATVDQCALADARFTLLAPDDYGEAFLEVVLWDGEGAEMARESLYEDDGEDEEEDAA